MAAGLVGVALLAMVSAMTKAKAPESLQLPPNFTSQQITAVGAITPIAGPLFHEYLLAFEVTSILLLSAIIGAVALARRREAEVADAR
jgi:NADH-quinone oxidoreductase subunit J